MAGASFLLCVFKIILFKEQFINMKITCIIYMILSGIVSDTNPGQANNGPVNYLNTPADLSFNNLTYGLSWTSHPSLEYYKQEYIPKGETVEKFTSMLMLEVLTSNVNLKDVVANKMTELRQMKARNPYVKFETTNDPATGEHILDFIVTANSQDGQILIAERNVYRYNTFSNKNSGKGVLLLGMSVRSYGAEAKKFLAAVEAGRPALVKKVKEFKIPAVAIK